MKRRIARTLDRTNACLSLYAGCLGVIVADWRIAPLHNVVYSALPGQVLPATKAIKCSKYLPRLAGPSSCQSRAETFGSLPRVFDVSPCLPKCGAAAECAGSTTILSAWRPIRGAVGHMPGIAKVETDGQEDRCRTKVRFCAHKVRPSGQAVPCRRRPTPAAGQR